MAVERGLRTRLVTLQDCSCYTTRKANTFYGMEHVLRLESSSSPSVCSFYKKVCMAEDGRWGRKGTAVIVSAQERTV